MIVDITIDIDYSINDEADNRNISCFKYLHEIIISTIEALKKTGFIGNNNEQITAKNIQQYENKTLTWNI